jgi:hypothetical protein
LLAGRYLPKLAVALTAAANFFVVVLLFRRRRRVAARRLASLLAFDPPKSSTETGMPRRSYLFGKRAFGSAETACHIAPASYIGT